MTQEFRGGPDARVGAKIYALQNARELCFEWGIGDTMPYEVAAAAKPPQLTPLSMGTRVDTREGNGEYRRRRAVVALACFLSLWKGNDGLNVRIAPRCGGGGT
jgi:hypothetical protein